MATARAKIGRPQATGGAAGKGAAAGAAGKGAAAGTAGKGAAAAGKGAGGGAASGKAAAGGGAAGARRDGTIDGLTKQLREVLEEVKGAGLSSAPGGIVAVGHDRFNSNAYWVYLIDDETGAVVARTSNVGTTGVHNLRHHVLGSRVLTHTRGVLHAYDSTTLEERWRAGDDP